MFLELAHTKLDVFTVAKQFVLLCYKETRVFPTEEKFALTSQIRRAAQSVYLNIAEGCSRRSPAERKRFYEISRGSLIEVDAALDIAIELNYHSKEKFQELGTFVIRTFQLISKLITSQARLY
ncbi:MAG TPA: four helix bundle protein [Chitinophagaceae bacterium]|jgi:four helix bundle protein|nr:four helix bundle protein [Chitinophagaceae bacterium]